MSHENKKGQWNSRFGFLMATVGSAVGLGNLWSFPYKMGKNGGFAFLIVYLVMVACVGIVLTLSELAIGRKSGKAVVDAYRTISKKYEIVGWFAWISPLLILGFYTMLGGYCLKYAVANLGDLFNVAWGVNGADSGAYFSAFYTDQLQTTLFTLIFVLLTITIVRGGVSGGIEKFSTIAMPALFVMLIIMIIRAVTMPGAGAGLAFVFTPNFEPFKGTGWISVLAAAGGQMFFSVSIAMGINVTYGSYMKKTESLQESGIIIPVADTIVAVMAAMAVMPAVFAAGLDPAAGPGLLFVTLQSVFQAMGSTVGPIFGFLMYMLVFVAALTSSIALFEVLVSVVIDKQYQRGKHPVRSKVAGIMGVVVAVEGIFISMDGLGANGFPQIFGQGCWLDTFDLLSEGILMPLGALIMAVILGWIVPGYVDTEIEHDAKGFTLKKFYYVCIKFIVPPVMILILAGQIDSFFGLGWF